ncbi:MAG: FkbM family methyltransferase [Bacteroidales bacterium]|nr:FkbM family methyltransferase [Bacteroidales bacterium]
MKFKENIKMLLSELWMINKSHIVFFKKIINAFRSTIFQSRIIKYKGFKIDTQNKFCNYSIRRNILFNFYESSELSIIERTLSKDDKVIEIGTGIGVTAMFAARIVGDNNISTYEASPELIPVIKRNFDLNNLNIRLENKILVNPNTSENFKKYYNNDVFFLGSTISNSEDNSYFEVPTEDFKMILEKEQASYLIIDIEGEEINLLNFTLPECVKKICIEVHPSYKGVGDKSISNMFLKLLQQGFHLILTNSSYMSFYLSRD